MYFAYLFGPPRVISRQEGVEVYDAVCEALGVDDLTYKYTANPSPDVPPPVAERSRGYSIQIERRIGRGTFKVTVDNATIQQPIRFLIEFTWPPSVEHVTQDFDTTAEAAFRVLSGDWQRVLAETRIRGQLEAAGGSALSFLTNRVLQLDAQRVASLEAQPEFVSVSLHTPAGHPTDGDPLHQPKRQAQLELLREDSRSIYVELVSQWPQLATSNVRGQLEIDARRIRHFDSPPSAYLRNSVEYLNDRLFPLFA